MKRYLLTLLLVWIFVPSVAFAAWWNPFSWNWRALFSDPEPVQELAPLAAEPESPLVGAEASLTVGAESPATKRSDVGAAVPAAPAEKVSVPVTAPSTEVSTPPDTSAEDAFLEERLMEEMEKLQREQERAAREAEEKQEECQELAEEYQKQDEKVSERQKEYLEDVKSLSEGFATSGYREKVEAELYRQYQYDLLEIQIEIEEARQAFYDAGC